MLNVEVHLLRHSIFRIGHSLFLLKKSPASYNPGLTPGYTSGNFFKKGPLPKSGTNRT